MPLSYSSYYVYDTGNGCLPCEVNGAIFFLLWCRVWVEIPFLCLFETRRPFPSKWNASFRSELSGLPAHFVCPAVCLRCAVLFSFFVCVCFFVCVFVCLSLPFFIRFSRHLRPSFFKFTYLCLIPPLHTFLNSLRLYPCHVNNWWPVFDWSAIAKGWPESWRQHQCRVKRTTATCAPPACRTCRRHSLLMTYFYLNEIPLVPAAFPKTVGFI